MTDVALQLSSRERAGLLALLLVFSLFGLFDHSLWSANDTREGAMIASMARGGSWTLPELNGVPYLEKPPLLHWTGAALCQLFGTVNEGLVRLPAALFGFGSLVLIWLFGRALGRERAGLLAAALCATALLMAEYARIVLTDTALTFVVLLSLWLFWCAYTAATWRLLRFTLFLLATALSFYAKGLLGPGFVWVSVGLFLLWRREWKMLFGLPLAFLPVFALVLAPWIAALWAAGGRDYLVGVFWDNQFGRFLAFSDQTLPHDPYFVHKEPLWYYLKSAPLRLLPWTLLVVPALMRWFRRGSEYRGDLALFLRLALVAMLVVLHVSSAKTACYLLPLFPLAFLMTGVWLEDRAQAGDARPWERLLVGATCGALCLLALLTPVGLLVANALRWTWDAKSYWPGPALTMYSSLLAGVALGLAVSFLLRLRRLAAARAVAWHGPQMFIVLMMVNFAALLPVLDAAKSYRPLADLVLQRVGADGRIAFASDDERDTGALVFYLGRHVDVLKNTDETIHYLRTARSPAGVIVPEAGIGELRQRLAGSSVRFFRAEHGGYKARSFWLLMPPS